MEKRIKCVCKLPGFMSNYEAMIIKGDGEFKGKLKLVRYNAGHYANENIHKCAPQYPSLIHCV